jgi:hypothetical protein
MRDRTTNPIGARRPIESQIHRAPRSGRVAPGAGECHQTITRSTAPTCDRLQQHLPSTLSQDPGAAQSYVFVLEPCRDEREAVPEAQALEPRNLFVRSNSHRTLPSSRDPQFLPMEQSRWALHDVLLAPRSARFEGATFTSSSDRGPWAHRADS